MSTHLKRGQCQRNLTQTPGVGAREAQRCPKERGCLRSHSRSYQGAGKCRGTQTEEEKDRIYVFRNPGKLLSSLFSLPFALPCLALPSFSHTLDFDSLPARRVRCNPSSSQKIRSSPSRCILVIQEAKLNPLVLLTLYNTISILKCPHPTLILALSDPV